MILKPSGLRVVGLTGGIGSGKSEVARVFLDAGIPVIDADAVGHDLMTPGSALFDAIRSTFGTDLVRSDGHIDRARLATLVFGDCDRLKTLNGLVHPAVFAEISRRLDVLEQMGHPVCLLEAAILIETGMDRELDGLLVVSAPETLRADWVEARDRMSREAFLARCRHQVSEAERVARATWVIHNHGSLDDLRIQARGVAVLIARGQKPLPPN